MSIINHIKNTFNDFLSPNYCLINGDEIPTEVRYFSQKAIDNLKLADESELLFNKFINSELENNHNINAYYSLLSLGDSRNFLEIIYNFKYYNLTKVGEELGKLLAKKILIETSLQYDYIVPVPIHKAKERERGYNQSTVLSKPISKMLNVPILDEYFYRKVYTQSQTKLNEKKRKLNVENIFEVNNTKNENNENNIIEGKNILIVDDVITTGATINSLAKIIKENGAAHIGASSIAVK